MPKGHPYKGIPRSEWPNAKAVRDEADAANITNLADGLNSAVPLQPATVAASAPRAAPRANSDTTIAPRNLFSGQQKKLEVYALDGTTDDPIPGYRLYWFNDVGGTGIRLNQARKSGWEFVNKDEVGLQENLVPGNNDVGTMVRTAVSPGPPPLYAYLMKKPEDLCRLHDAEREQYHQMIESELRSGRHGQQAGDKRYTAKDVRGSRLPEIEIESSLNR